MKRNGLSLIEMVMSLGVLALIVGAVAIGIKEVRTRQASKENSVDVNHELILAMQSIKRIGRSATSCSVSGPSTARVLECTGKFTDDSNQTIRFLITDKGFEQQRASGANWESGVVYSSVKTWEICGDAQLADAANLCPDIKPLFSYPAASAIRNNRFYRFRIGKNARNQVQSAFYVRNPGDLRAGITYKKGW